jgi:PAS domain S-box-containing protein
VISQEFEKEPFWNNSRIGIARRYQLLINAVSDYGIFMLDPMGRVATWNPGAEKIKGYAAHEILWRHFSIFYPKEDIEAGKPALLLEKALAQGHVEDEGWRLRKDGTRFWANVVITAIHDERGVLLGFAKVTRDMTSRKRLEELERTHLASVQIGQARESEQKRIARELHDDLGQQITALKMSVALREVELVQQVPQVYREQLISSAELGEQIDAMAVSLRRIASDLRPPLLDDLGLEAALELMAEGFEHRYGVLARCLAGGEALCLSDLASISLYRVAQEALTNVARHAQANEVTISLSRDELYCYLRIQDDGVGFELAGTRRPESFGLVGMNERIQQLGGTLSVESSPGTGVTVAAKLPLSGITITA